MFCVSRFLFVFGQLNLDILDLFHLLFHLLIQDLQVECSNLGQYSWSCRLFHFGLLIWLKITCSIMFTHVLIPLDSFVVPSFSSSITSLQHTRVPAIDPPEFPCPSTNGATSLATSSYVIMLLSAPCIYYREVQHGLLFHESMGFSHEP